LHEHPASPASSELRMGAGALQQPSALSAAAKMHACVPRMRRSAISIAFPPMLLLDDQLRPSALPPSHATIRLIRCWHEQTCSLTFPLPILLCAQESTPIEGHSTARAVLDDDREMVSEPPCLEPALDGHPACHRTMPALTFYAGFSAAHWGGPRVDWLLRR
jgi:hypothetical protein